MRLVLFSAAIAVCSCARLENNYLPPSNAPTAGGGPGLRPPVNGRPQGGGYPGSGGFSGASGGGFPGPSGGGFSGSGGNAGPPSGPPIAILSQTNEHNDDGSYRWSFESENGIKAEEQGELKNKGSESEAQSVVGSYSYTGPDGQVYTVTYTADENGFRPQGAHLPTPPPIPDAILKSLEANAAEEARGGGGGGGFSSGGGGGRAGYPSGGPGGFPGTGPTNQYVPPSRPAARPSGNGGFSPQNGYRY